MGTVVAPVNVAVKPLWDAAAWRAAMVARMFEKVLILRRGEAATRVARTCRRLGVESIIVAPKDEPASRHVEAADRVIEVDFAEADGIPTELLPSILDQASADAAHVGYQGQPGMFELASAAEKADVAVVGTDLDVLGALTDPTTVAGAAERGHVRSVHGSGHLDRPREISVLVASDAHGATAAIAECDRSLQTDGHTLLQETPSPELSFRPDGEAFRMSLFESARNIASELRYAGLLEVVFLIDPQRLSWASEVKIGLPRHHTLIEMVTGTDLVALQLAIASGEPLGPEVHSIQCSGHALDASIVALDHETEPVATFAVAPAPQGRIRATSSATVGLPLPADDRPLIAKLTTHAPIRHRAMLSMDRMLAEMRIEPFATNVEALRRILGDYSFRAGQYDRESAQRFIGV
jgi:acetyl-CoA/propionyl-CoA carboxylase biotin carboxyl carrier protein